MSDALALVPSSVDPTAYFSRAQIDLIKRQIARGVTDDELQLFLYQCARTGLDPLSRQIYALERREKVGNEWVSRMSIQTGIDGFRLIAERTGRYAPGPEATFDYDAKGNLRKATAFVKKLTADGTWHEVSASAFWPEYVATNKEGRPTRIWAEKPHVMLSKCAESLALRKAFPAEMSGLYTAEEMDKANAPTVDYQPPAPEAAEQPTPKAAPAAATTPASQRPPSAASPVTNRTSSPDAPAPSASTDSGEAPGEEDLDEFHDLVVKKLRWRSQHVRNWCAKYFGVRSPESFSRQQLRDAFTLADAFARSRDEYAAKVKELAAAGRINADAPTPTPERR